MSATLRDVLQEALSNALLACKGLQDSLDSDQLAEGCDWLSSLSGDATDALNRTAEFEDER